MGLNRGSGGDKGREADSHLEVNAAPSGRAGSGEVQTTLEPGRCLKSWGASQQGPSGAPGGEAAHVGISLVCGSLGWLCPCLCTAGPCSHFLLSLAGRRPGSHSGLPSPYRQPPPLSSPPILGSTDPSRRLRAREAAAIFSISAPPPLPHLGLLGKSGGCGGAERGGPHRRGTGQISFPSVPIGCAGSLGELKFHPT